MNVSDTKVTAPTQEEIRQEAYYMWEREGRPAGRDFEFWLRAELELRQHKSETPVSKAWALPKTRGAGVKATRSGSETAVRNGKATVKAAAPKAPAKPTAVKKARKSA